MVGRVHRKHTKKAVVVSSVDQFALSNKVVDIKPSKYATHVKDLRKEVADMQRKTQEKVK